MKRQETKIKLSSFKNLHKNDTFIVCGCGSSLSTFKPTQNTITIGVNDVGRQFTPDYLVVLNPKNQFKADRFSYVENSAAKALFTQLKLAISHSANTHPNIVPIKLGKRGGTDCFDAAGLPFTRNSPYVALCLAMYMGAKRIGLIGVDFTEHHFFSKTGRHSLAGSLKSINLEYQKLYRAAQAKGIEIVNLSPHSRIDAFPKIKMEDFLLSSHPKVKTLPAVEAPQEKQLNIVSYSTSPVAGVPEILSRCINHYTPHQSRCVWATNNYGNGVVFNSDVEWNRKPAEALALLKNADLVIVHNGKVAPAHKALLKNKPVITMAHNYLWNVDKTFVSAGYPGVVVGQYQAALPEFDGWNAVPNPLPLWEKEYQHKPSQNKDITICYTPSGKHESYPKQHRLYWHSKGYVSTMAILQRLAKRYPLKLEVIGDKQLSHKQVLAMKQRSHIVIDECVTGSYHRNSLEGLACACVVINGMGIWPKVVDVFNRCLDESSPLPFVGCTLEQLENVLVDLINQGRDALLERGEKNRAWMLHYWNFEAQWKQFWRPVVEIAMQKNASNPHKKIQQKSIKARPQPAQIREAPVVAPADEISATSRLLKGSKLSVYWTCRGGSHGSRRGNFGDMLSPVLSHALSGKTAAFLSTGPRLFAVGSLLKFAKAGDVVWGTGFISEQDTCAAGVIIKAVRGPLTRAMLLKQGIDCPPVYGDPGLLLPAIYKSPVKACYRVGIIPHYVDMDKIRSTIKDSKIRIIDVRAGVDSVIQQARKCEILLSSSLHGCILGEAYGIPTAWVELSDRVVGGGFKFRDYYASTDRDPVHVDWRQRININEAVSSALNSGHAKIDLTPLIASFPLLSVGAKKFENFKVWPRRAVQSAEETYLEPKPRRKNVAIKTKVASEQAALPLRVSPKKVAVFGAVTENYSEYMIASLRSFMKHNDSTLFDYFILGNAFSARTQRLINQHGIRYININLHKDFRRTAKHRYPGECFWIFKGPEIFHKMGYPYSLSVDGDTLCNKTLELDWLVELKHIAGIDRGCSVGEFLHNIGQLAQLKNKMGISEENTIRRATNTGVLFYNNVELKKIDFYSRMVKTYKCSERAGILRGGDDSSLALLFAVHSDVSLHVLEVGWNVYQGLFGNNSHQMKTRSNSEKNSQAFIIHLSSIKPWQHHRVFPSSEVRTFIDQWRALWPNTRNQRRISALDQRSKLRQSIRRIAHPVSTSRPGLTPNISTNRYAVYWYRGAQPNMGDEITPYLLSKLLNCHISSIQKQKTKEPLTHKGPVLISVGSVLRLCGNNTVIWGSGIRNINQPVSKALQFCAVRGPLTRRRLLHLGYNCPEVYGDPALLLPRFYQPRVSKSFTLGIIPHLVDHEFMSRLYAGRKDVHVIDVKSTDIESIVKQIARCHCTVSSSLHGIILSVAYGIPTRWVKFSNKIMGDDSKFYDFFASLEPRIEHHLDYKKLALPEVDSTFAQYIPLNISKAGLAVDALVTSTHTFNLSLDLDKLLAAFPLESLNRLKLIA